jgi:hypothetical protein
MLSFDRRHRTLSRFVTRLLMVLGLAAGTLLVAAGPAAAGSCIDVYQNGYGTTVCTP